MSSTQTRGPGVGEPLPGDESSSQALTPLFAVCIAFLVINTLFVFLRFLTVLHLRARKQALAWDDWLLIPAYLANVAVCAIGFIMQDIENKPFITAHQVILDPKLNVPLLKCIFAVVLFLQAGYSLTRLSILALFLRLFTGKWTRRVCWIMVGFVCCQWIAFNFAAIFQCRPVNYFWWRAYGPASPVKGSCYNVDHLYRALTPPSIFSDVILIVTPLPTVWGLNSSSMRKLGLTIVFSSGFVALIGSIVRQVEFVNNSAHNLVPVITNVLISWVVVEPSLYLVTACLPPLYPLLRLILPASVRNRANVPNDAKSISAPRSRGSGHHGDFKRLVDHDAGLRGTGRAEAGTKAWEAGNSNSTPQRLEAANQSRNHQSGVTDVPLQDLRTITEGGGVLVTKEITVTQEQRIQDLIGF